MSSRTGVDLAANLNGSDAGDTQKQQASIALLQKGSRLSRTVLTSIEQLRTLLDFMIDERVAELLEEQNRLPRFGDEDQSRVDSIDRQLGKYTNQNSIPGS